MADDSPLLSIVCPAFNEAEGLPHFHLALTEALASLEGGYRFEIIYVDDGSRDGTPDVLRQIARTDGRVRVLTFTRNFGHQAALTAGLDYACGDAVVTLDTDLQHPPRLIPDLVAAWRAGHDVVLTIRADDRRLGWFKRVTSEGYYVLLRRWTDLNVRRGASDFRLLSRRAVEALSRLRESHRFLRGMVRWLGFPVAEVPFQPDARWAGVSKYSVSRMLRLAVDGLCSFSHAPLRLSAGVGLGLTALSFVGTAIVMALRPPHAVLAMLAVAIHIVGGCLLVAMAVLGEYVGRIYQECKGRPLYVLSEGHSIEIPAVRPDANAA